MEEGRGRERWVPAGWYFPGPLCRQVKPKPTTVTHTWLALNAQNTLSRITSTGVQKQTVVLYFTLGFRNHTAGLINYQMAHLRPTLNKFWTNRHTYRHTDIHYIQTYIHTMFFVGRGGDCSALPCLPLFHDNNN